MPNLTAATVPITPGSGVNVKTFIDASGNEYQAVVIADQAGNLFTSDGNGNMNVALGNGIRQDLDSITTFATGSLTSNIITSSGAASSLASKVKGILIGTAGAGATVQLLDGGSSGAAKSPVIPITAGQYIPLPSVQMAIGAYLVFTGSGNSAMVYYDVSTG